MKILHVIPIFSPPQLFGGSQRVVYLVSKELAKKGHEVVIYASDMKTLRERTDKIIENINGVTVVHFKNVSSLLSSKTRLILTPRMKTDFESELRDFDVIHVHEARGFQHILVWWLTRKADVPYVVQAHGNLSEHFGGFSRRIYDALFGKRILGDASKVIAVNRVEASNYTNFGVAKGKVEIIPNPIDKGEFYDLGGRGLFREKYNIEPNSKVILFIGRVHPIKGVDILLHAFANIVSEGKVEATLVIAGPDDGYVTECIKIAKTHKLNNIIFAGQLWGKERIHAYFDADVIVLPSRYETFPMSVLEAYACGKPVVASKVGGLEELISNGETGELVNSGNISELSEAITHVLSWDSFHNVAINARNRIMQRYSLESVVNKLELLYRKLS